MIKEQKSAKERKIFPRFLTSGWNGWAWDNFTGQAPRLPRFPVFLVPPRNCNRAHKQHRHLHETRDQHIVFLFCHPVSQSTDPCSDELCMQRAQLGLWLHLHFNTRQWSDAGFYRKVDQNIHMIHPNCQPCSWKGVLTWNTKLCQTQSRKYPLETLSVNDHLILICPS